MVRKGLLFLLAICCETLVQGQTLDIAGTLEWETMKISASVALNLASAGIRLPTGRAQAEELADIEYPRLIRPSLLSIPVDSSSTLQDLVDRGEFSLQSMGAIAQAAIRAPPALSTDLSSLTISYTIDLAWFSAALIRHRRPAEHTRPLRPLPAASYTGIIILAAEPLPIRGRNSAALIQPCLFPKVWDTDMNLIYERSMTDPGLGAVMVRYVPSSSVFQPSPSGLSPELAALVGNNPLRIIARGVYGIRPTDPVIDREDALLILSSENNLQLLREARVAIMVDQGVLQNPLIRE
jgi:hypothetical protein